MAKQSCLTLPNLIMQAFLAADTEGTSIVLSGVFVEFRDDSVTVAATDGKIIIEYVVPYEDSPVITPKPDGLVGKSFIMSTLAKSQLKAWLSLCREHFKRGGKFTIVVNEDNVEFAVPFAKVILQTIAGVYPSYRPALDNEGERGLSAKSGCMNGEYLTRMNDLIYPVKSCAKPAIMFSHQNMSNFFAPLNTPVGYSVKGLIMAIMIPKER